MKQCIAVLGIMSLCSCANMHEVSSNTSAEFMQVDQDLSDRSSDDRNRQYYPHSLDPTSGTVPIFNLFKLESQKTYR